MEIRNNDLYRDSTLGCLVRVVYVDQKNLRIHLFACRDKITECVMPFSFSFEEVKNQLKSGSLVFEKIDPFVRIIDEDEIKPKDVRSRDKAYKVVSSLIREGESDILSSVLRNILVRRAMRAYSVSKPYVYKYLKKYWRDGMNKNALLKDYRGSGAPGKERKSETTPEIRKLCQRGFKKFHIDKGYTIKTAFDETIRKLFDKSKHGEKFSFSVFWDHGRRPYLNRKAVRKLKGDKDFDNNIRALKGRSLDMVTGPCQLYQIDSTPRDIKIVASFDSARCIGRPTFYVVKDVFSRAIVGFYITLDPPSYIAACTALYNAFIPKDILLKELGLGKKHLGWSNHFLPLEIVADRAELFGPKGDSIVNNLDVILGNTAGYSPWMKGDVEKIIDMVQTRVHDLFLGRGQVRKGNPRVTKDSSQEATVTLRQLYRITWIVINEYNNTHWIDGYPLSEGMIRDRVDKIPVEIHKWAIKNRLGKERTMNTESLYLSLLESKEVSQNREGMRLNGQDYVPDSEEGFKLWEDLLTSNNNEKVSLVYDPRQYRNIFWKYKSQFHKLRLRGVKDVLYENEWEARSVLGTYSDKRRKAQSIEQDVRNENNTEIEEIFNAADTQEKRKTKNSKQARKIDKAIEHQRLRNPVSPKKQKSEGSKVIENKNSQSKYNSLIEELNA